MLGVPTHVDHSTRTLTIAEHVRDRLGLAQELVLHVVLALAFPREGHMQLCEGPGLQVVFQLRLVNEVLMPGAAAEEQIRRADLETCEAPRACHPFKRHTHTESVMSGVERVTATDCSLPRQVLLQGTS